MQLTKGAIGNLINRYKAVLKKCHLLNAFGSLAVAGMLVMGSAGMAGAENVAIEEAALSYDGATILENSNINPPKYTLKNGVVTITADGVSHTGRGVLTNLYQHPDNLEYVSSTGLSIASSTFSDNKNTLNNGAGGGAVSLWSNGDAAIGLSHSISSTTFTNNSSDLGGAVAIMKQGSFNTSGSTTFTDVPFIGNTAKYGGAIYAEKENITISGTSRFEGNSATVEGGAIYLANQSNLKIEGGSFIGNTATGTTSQGGAIFISTDSTLNIDGANFKNNMVGKADGASYWAYGGAILNANELRITNTTFEGNIAGSVGGALATTTKSKATHVANSTFINNHSVYDGGAIGNYGGMTIENCLFEGNTAQLGLDEAGNWTKAVSDSSAVGGGAISFGAVSNSQLNSFTNTIFKNNISGTHGGAIATRMGKNANNSVATLDIAATFIGNQAQQGGAIYNTFYTNNRLGKGDGVTVTGIFSENKASDKGGAIFNDGAQDLSGAKGGVMTVTDSTFTGNTAAAGGAIYNTGTLTVEGGNFTDNSAAPADGSDVTVSNVGGAIYNADDAELSINGTRFEGNTAAIAGAVNNQFDSSHITGITNAVFVNNTASLSAGGALRNQGGIDSIAGTTFEGNTAGNGGALWNGAGGTITSITDTTFTGNKSTDPAVGGGAITNAGEIAKINATTFTDNSAAGDGGAIYNVKSGGGTASITLSNTTFTGNTADGNGGAIYNGGNLTFSGNNTFSGNTAAEGKDIYNAGTITVADGTTTLGSGLTQVGGQITVTGGTLDMASGSSLSFDASSALTINGGTFVADFDQLLTDYTTTNDKNGISGNNIIGASGNLNLRLDGGTYTLDQYNDAKETLLGQATTPENATLNFLNATLDTEGKDLVVGAEQSGNEVTIQTAPVVVTETDAPSTAAGAGNEIPSVPDQIVSVVSNDASKTLLEANTIAVSGREFTAKGLEIAGTAGAEAVTLKVTNNSDITLAGGEAGFTGVVANNDNVVTNVATDVVVNNASLTVGLEGNASAQNLALNDVTVADGGTFAVAGNGLDTTQVEASTLTTEESGTVAVNNATLTVQETVVSTGVLSITNAVSDLGTVDFSGGVLFFDPSYNTHTFKDGAVGGLFLTSDGSVVNVDSGLDNLQELAQKAGLTTTAIGSGQFTVGTGQSMLALGQNLTLTGSGQVIVDDGVTYEDTGSTYEAKIGGQTINDGAYFGTDSLLVVNGNTINGTAAAINLATATNKTLTVQNGAKLLIADAVAGQTYTVISGADNADASGGTAFNSTSYTDASATGWKDANLLTSSDMVTLTSDNGTVFTAKSNDAATVFPRLSDGMADAVNTLYGQQLNNVDSPDMGVRFLSRATDNRYLGEDKDAAASTIESAARMAFAGAVPQMTKMASDAATNAVVNRLGFANPADGIQAMDAEGRIVDRNTTGFALWIAPLWQNMHGWSMEAGNLDYGFNGNLGGVSLGADYTFENAIRAGITFNIGGGYAESSGGDLSSTQNNMNFWGLGAYVGWNYQNFGLMADVAYTSTWNDLSQDMDGRMGMGDLEADVQASALSAGVRAEYKLETSVLDVIPHIGVRYMSLNTWGYDVESSGGTLLEADGFHQDIWTFPVGITFSKDLQMGNGWAFTPSVDFSVIPAAGDIEAKHDVAFTGLPGSYEVETQMMDYLTWQGGIGLELGNENMSIGVNYTLQAGQNSTGHGLFGSFRYEF